MAIVVLERAPEAKRRKKSKCAPAKAAVEPVPAPPAESQHATDSKPKRKKKAWKRKPRVGNELAAQPDAPAARPPLVAVAAAPTTLGLAAPRSAPSLAGSKKGKGGGSVLQQMRQRLQGGRFRWLNETLYTSDGAAALDMVQKQPELMDQYHEGFREQTKAWPVQPVDQAIAWLRSKPSSWVVADLGCGDARIASTAAQTVHSFDLSVTAPGVVACNMAAVPLPAASVDAAIFCLSLMGTDYGSFIAEAARILKPAGGWLWVAEVQSRFMSDGDGNSVLPAFLAALEQLGFAVKRKDTTNSHFLVLELQRQQQQRQKAGGSGSGSGGMRPSWPELRACQYKKR